MDSVYVIFHGRGPNCADRDFYFPFRFRAEAAECTGDLLHFYLYRTPGGEYIKYLAGDTLTCEDFADTTYLPDIQLGYKGSDEWGLFLVVRWLGKAKVWVDWFGVQDEKGRELTDGLADGSIMNYIDRYSFNGAPGIIGFYMREELWEDANVYPQKRVDSLIKEAGLIPFTEHHWLFWWGDRNQYGGRNAISARLQPGTPNTMLLYPYSGYHFQQIDPVKKVAYGLSASVDTVLLASPENPCEESGDTAVCLQEKMDGVARYLTLYKGLADSTSSDTISNKFVPFLQAFAHHTRLKPETCDGDTNPPWRVAMREQSKEEACLLASMALAYGANGLLYYTLGSYGNLYDDLSCGDTTIRWLKYKEWKGLAALPEIQDALEFYVGPLVDSLGYLFYRFDWQGAGRAGSGAFDTISGSFIDSIISDEFDEPYIEMGFFADVQDDSADYFFMVNRRAYDSAQTLHVWFEGGTYLTTDMYSYDSMLVGDALCSSASHLSTTLDPGQGKLFRVESVCGARPFLSSLEEISGGALFVTCSTYQDCETGFRYFDLVNDTDWTDQTVRVWLDEDSLGFPHPAEMYYIVDQDSYDSTVTGPMPGTDTIPITTWVQRASGKTFLVIPIDSTEGLPDSLLPLTWQGCIKVAGKTVDSAKTLNIYPPALVKLGTDARIEVEGAIQAIGTTTDTISFISSAASPAAGDWDWIKIVGGGEATFDYCRFKHGYKAVWAKSYTADTLDYSDSALTISIDHCSFDSIEVAGIEFWTVPTSDLAVLHSTIKGCGSYGMRVKAGLPTIKHNNFGPPENHSWYSCAVGGNADFVAGGVVDNNTFDIEGGWALYLSYLNHSAYDSVFRAQFNQINAEINSISFGGIFVYDCDDLVLLKQNKIHNDSSLGYGILTYLSRPGIAGDGMGNRSSKKISGWTYGLGTAGKSSVGSPDHPIVIDATFKDNDYHVYVYNGSACLLGWLPCDGNNWFGAQSCSTYTVYNASSETVYARRNCWDGENEDCWPFTYGDVDTNLTAECGLSLPKSAEADSASEVNMPREFKLEQNHPNPFNLATRIQFALPKACQVRISIYNILGQRIRDVIDRELAAGIHGVPWDGKNDRGVTAAAGVYFYRIEAGDFVDTKKMVMIK